MKFVIQIIQGQTKLDLCQAMDKAIEYYQWKNDPFDDVIYTDIDNIKEFAREDYCPVGTLEFVFKYIDTLYGDNAHLKIKPLNIPEWARKFAYGKVYNSDTDELNDWINILSLSADGIKWFMKSTEFFKDPDNGFIDNLSKVKSHFILTQVIPDILSEWRIFIHKGKPIDIKNYDGDPFIFPDKKDIDEICNANTNIQYGTIDIAVVNSETSSNKSYVMECHDFFSCGLYGFDHPNELPLMLWRTWINLKKLI